MLGNTRNETLRRFVDAQNEALNCLTAERLVAFPAQSEPSRTTFTIQPGRVHGRSNLGLIALRGDQGLSLDIQLVVTIVEADAINVDSYAYGLFASFDDHPREVIAFHWTPTAPGPQRRYPHMHIGSLVTSGSPFHGGDFNKLHIPTGPVSLEAVLLFAVEELGVEPARGRDRAAVVDQLRADFRGEH